MTALLEEKIMDREQDAGGFWGGIFLSDDMVQVVGIGMSSQRGRCREKMKDSGGYEGLKNYGRFLFI